jgi:hypothetical protein
MWNTISLAFCTVSLGGREPSMEAVFDGLYHMHGIVKACLSLLCASTFSLICSNLLQYHQRKFQVPCRGVQHLRPRALPCRSRTGNPRARRLLCSAVAFTPGTSLSCLLSRLSTYDARWMEPLWGTLGCAVIGMVQIGLSCAVFCRPRRMIEQRTLGCVFIGKSGVTLIETSKGQADKAWPTIACIASAFSSLDEEDDRTIYDMTWVWIIDTSNHRAFI